MHPERMYSQLVEKVQLMLDLIEKDTQIQPSPVFIPEAVLINPYTIKEGITKARSCPGLCAVEPVPARGWSAYLWTRSLGYTVSPLH